MNYLLAGMVNMPLSPCNIDATSSLCSQDRFEVAMPTVNNASYRETALSPIIKCVPTLIICSSNSIFKASHRFLPFLFPVIICSFIIMHLFCLKFRRIGPALHPAKMLHNFQTHHPFTCVLDILPSERNYSFNCKIVNWTILPERACMMKI